MHNMLSISIDQRSEKFHLRVVRYSVFGAPYITVSMNVSSLISMSFTARICNMLSAGSISCEGAGNER
jgi:hypothetical protein